MSNRVEHAVNTLPLDKQLVDVESGAARVSQTEAGADILLVDVPKRGVVINSLRRETEELSLGGELNLGASHNPLLLLADCHQSQLFDVSTLRVVDEDGRTSAVDGKGGANKLTSGEALDVSRSPDTEDGAYREVAVDDRAAVNGVESNKVLATLTEDGLGGSLLGGSRGDDTGALQMLQDDLLSLEVDI